MLCINALGEFLVPLCVVIEFQLLTSLSFLLVPVVRSDQSSLEAKHASECKGLMLQIRYLKAKFMRESDLRADLTHQKSYLLQLIGGLELSEAATAQFIADVGVSRGTITPTRTPSRTFKKVALAVKASVRMQLMTKRWRETCEVKATLREAHSANAKLRAERERFARGV